ncbi:hypothetical protein, partial [Vibrio fujianensis]|uniref:hypothetical protein n=1 Tax=Vibrio fujianensis TaxID=1974215 RepID=UPI001C12C08D
MSDDSCHSFVAYRQRQVVSVQSEVSIMGLITGRLHYLESENSGDHTGKIKKRKRLPLSVVKLNASIIARILVSR